MRRIATRSWLVPAAAALALAAAVFVARPAAAGVFDLDEWKADESGWEDVGLGTSIRYRFTRERFVPGMEAPVTTVTESERTLAERSEAKFVFRTRVKVGDVWQAVREVSETRPAKNTYRVEEERSTTTEQVVVEGQAYTCRRVAFTRYKGAAVDDTLVAWIHEEHGVLKSQQAAGPDSTLTQTVTKLAVEREVGGTTLRCQEFSIEAPGTRGRVVVSASVPGRIVEMDVTIEGEGSRSINRQLLTSLTRK